MSWMTVPFDERTKPLLHQYLSRPPGFGVLETFCPLLSTDTHSVLVGKRLKFWGCDRDWDYDSYKPKYTPPVNDVTFRGPSGVLHAIFDLFGGAAHLGAEASGRVIEPEEALSPDIQARWAATRKKIHRVPANAHEIFKLKWHQCQHCEKKLAEHVNGQCLFGPTRFTPMCTEWRTLIGDFSWDPKSGLFVSVAGNTTTTTTTATTTPGAPSKATPAKRKPKQSPKNETSTESES